MRHFEFSATPADEKKRLDVFLAAVQAEASRTRIQKLIEEGRRITSYNVCYTKLLRKK